MIKDDIKLLVRPILYTTIFWLLWFNVGLGLDLILDSFNEIKLGELIYFTTLITPSFFLGYVINQLVNSLESLK